MKRRVLIFVLLLVSLFLISVGFSFGFFEKETIERSRFNCVDDEVDIDYSVKGAFTYYRGGAEDKCETTTIHGELVEDALLEYFCSDIGFVHLIYHKCANGCEGGRCIGEEIMPENELNYINYAKNPDGLNPYCFDSDGGIDLFVRGTLDSFYWDGIEHWTGLRELSDDCISTSKGPRLREYYCNEENMVVPTYFICNDICVEGVCLGGGIRTDEVENNEGIF